MRMYVTYQQQPNSKEYYAEFSSCLEMRKDIRDTIEKVSVFRMFIGVVGKEYKQRRIV